MTEQPPPTVDAKQTDPRTWAIVIWGLYLASLVTAGIAEVIGLIIAYVKRDDLAGTPFESHATSAIRTFWIALIGSLASIPLSFIGVGFVVLILIVVWQFFRTIRGLISAIDGKPIIDPEGWL